MAATLSAQRCFNHLDREAAARCPQCRRHFCRECVTEHGDRVLCNACLRAKMAAEPTQKSSRLKQIAGMTVSLTGGIVCFFFFYVLGRVLLAIPTQYHEGTLWKTAWKGLQP